MRTTARHAQRAGRIDDLAGRDGPGFRQAQIMLPVLDCRRCGVGKLVVHRDPAVAKGLQILFQLGHIAAMQPDGELPIHGQRAVEEHHRLIVGAQHWLSPSDDCAGRRQPGHGPGGLRAQRLRRSIADTAIDGRVLHQVPPDDRHRSRGLRALRRLREGTMAEPDRGGCGRGEHHSDGTRDQHNARSMPSPTTRGGSASVEEG